MPNRFWFLSFLWLFCGLTSTEVRAWGFEVHELIARQAHALLTASTRQWVDELLSQEPGASLPSISTWADRHREFPTATWHYVNFPRGECQYERERDCPDGHCVIEAFPVQLKLLQSSKDPQERFRALKFVVHLLSDVHQPLHAAWGEDRGGNRFQLQAFGRGSNLHAFWDSTIARESEGGIEAIEKDVQAQVEMLNAKASKGGASRTSGVGIRQTPVAQWAMESCRIVAQEGFYPKARELDRVYVQQHRATVVMRLALASRRLADTLNGVAAERQ